MNPNTVTVAEGTVARKYEETASRDHNVTLVAGTYSLETHRTPEGYITHYSAAIPAVAHDHWASTVEFGGVVLAGEDRGGETETFGFHCYGYEVVKVNDGGSFLLR